MRRLLLAVSLMLVALGLVVLLVVPAVARAAPAWSAAGPTARLGQANRTDAPGIYYLVCYGQTGVDNQNPYDNYIWGAVQVNCVTSADNPNWRSWVTFSLGGEMWDGFTRRAYGAAYGGFNASCNGEDCRFANWNYQLAPNGSGQWWHRGLTILQVPSSWRWTQWNTTNQDCSRPNPQTLVCWRASPKVPH